MKSYTIISPIDDEEFYKRWDCSEINNPNSDQNSIDRLKKIRRKNIIVSWIEIDKMDTINKIILPYHDSNSHFFKTSNGGTSLKEFMERYKFNQLNENNSDECIHRINFQTYCFKNRLRYKSSFYEGFFMYATLIADPDLGQKNKNGEFLYAGNFHQFASYGLLIQRDGFKPIRLFLCANAT